MTTPSSAPSKVVAAVSAAAIRATCPGVAPIRRRVAKRSARWAAPRSVTMAIRRSTGTRVAIAPMAATIRQTWEA